MQDSYKIVSSSILYWFSQKKWFVFSIIFALIFIGLPTPIGLSIPAYHSLIILFMVFILVTSEAIPFPAIALLALVLQVLLGVAPADIVASSFMNDAVLFVMGSLMFAIAIVHQGLDIRLAKIIISIFGKSKRLFLAGLMVVSAVLSSFLGEHTIIAIMLPIGLAIIKNVDSSKPDGKNAILLVLFSIAYGTIIGSIGTPSGGARNVIMINYLQEFTDTERIDYWRWIQYAYPILIIQLVVAYFVLQFAFPTSLDNVQVQGYKRSIAKSNSATNIRHLFSCLIIGLIIASWFLFNQELGLGIIALCGALIFMICGMVSWEVINKNTNWGVILLFAATISLGFQINETGASSWLVDRFNELTSSFPEDSSFSWSFMAILTGLTSNFFTSSATTSLLGPMAIELQPNDVSFGMSAAIASGFSFLTVISSPTAMIVYSTGLVSIKIFFRVGLLMFSSSILILYLVSKFYWVTL